MTNGRKTRRIYNFPRTLLIISPMPIGLMPPLPSFLFSAIAPPAIYDSIDFGSTNSVHILLP